MILLAQGKKQAEIAKALGRSSSTISRELKRHALESYSATNAQNSYLKHRQNSKAQRKLEQPEYFNLVQEKFLTENWSPEQISARLKLEKSELSIRKKNQPQTEITATKMDSNNAIKVMLSHMLDESFKTNEAVNAIVMKLMIIMAANKYCTMFFIVLGCSPILSL